MAIQFKIRDAEDHSISAFSIRKQCKLKLIFEVELKNKLSGFQLHEVNKTISNVASNLFITVKFGCSLTKNFINKLSHSISLNENQRDPAIFRKTISSYLSIQFQYSKKSKQVATSNELLILLPDRYSTFQIFINPGRKSCLLITQLWKEQTQET